MVSAIVSHKVHDFDTWLPEFEAHNDMMREFGFTELKVLRATDDPNHVTVVGICKDPVKMQQFFESEELKNAMVKSGVIGMPTITTHQVAGSY